MARIIIKFIKEDILTRRIGENIMIAGKELDLVFSRDALEELIKDYNVIKLAELAERLDEIEKE